LKLPSAERAEEDPLSEPIKLLDVVALTTDIPERGLVRGQVGTVVSVVLGLAPPMDERCARSMRRRARRRS
jgi:hypothetical protein